MAKLSVQERLERLREAGRQRSGQGGQQSSPTPTVTSGRTTAGMTVRERLDRLKEAGKQQPSALPTVSGQKKENTLQKAKRPATAGKPSKITSPTLEVENQAAELRTLRDEAHQEFLNFRGAEITAGATGMPTEPYAGQRYRTAEEAYQAWQDYDRQYAEFRNQYYQEENERQQARLAGDTAMQARFARADEIRAALNRIQSLEQTRAAAPGPMTEDAVSQALQEIVGQYGLSQEDGRDLTTARKALEAQLLDETDRLSAAGYDYERMTEYQRRQQTAAEAERQRQQTEAWAEEHPVLASIASVAAAPLQAIDIPRLIASGGGNEDDLRTYTPADPNSALVTGFVTTVRDTVSKQIEENTDWDLFGQNVASFLYNTGLSVGDSALQVGLLGPWATYLMGASAASQQAVNVLERGGSNSQAFWGGLAAGAAEAVFEKFSVDRLLRARNVNSVKDLLRETAKQAGTEASEEMLTEVANILSDTAVMGQSSDFEQLVTQYQLMGMGEDEARKQAYLDSLSQVVWAGVGGALSGAAMGGGLGGVDLAGRTVQQRQQQTTSRAIDEAYATMRREGLFSPAARQAAGQAQQRVDEADRREARAYNNNYIGRPQRQTSQGTQTRQDIPQQEQRTQDTPAEPAGAQDAAQEGREETAADPVVQILESGRRVDQAALSNEQFAALADRGDMDVDAGGRVYRVDPGQHIDQRSSEDMGDRKINAFQFDHPEVHRYYSEAAAELLNELSVTERGGQTLRLGDYQTGYEYRRTRRAAPERIATLLDDYGLSYDQIEKALDAIIHNHGQENIAAAKRVEFVLDDMLTNGYQSMNGYIPPNQEYIKAKASIAGYVEPTEGGSGYLDGIDEVPMTAERTKQNGQQEAEPGDGVSDGDLGRLSGTGAGEQAGGMGTGTERGRGPTDTFRTARERQNSVHHLRGEQISSRDLGLLRGTDAKTIRIVPESAWDDSLRATADRVRNETGLDTVFVIGGIQIESPDGARLARGVYTADRIIVQADNIRVTPDQIADHEIFHDRAAQTPGLVRELEDRVREQYGPEELGRVVEQYIRKLRGVIDVTENAGDDGTQAEAWDILEEIFADAYAGINAFSAHAERFNETVEQTMADRGVGRGGQNAAATDRTTGPPAEGRYSFGGENARRANLDALDQAKEMERQGVAMETIFRETGWYTGADGKWRFEIDDSGMEYSRWGDLNRSDRAEYARFRELEGKFIDGSITLEEQNELRQLIDQGHGPGRAEEQQTLQLSDFVRHDELYRNYPQLREAGLRFADLPDGTMGSYNPGTNAITLDNSLRTSPEDTLVHEIQHAIQSAEGFAGGASSEYWEDVKIDAQLAASAARENLQLWLRDIGYQDYVRQSMDRVVAGEITLDQHWENLQRFKENSDRAREIAVSEEEVARYEERLREIDQMGMTARELYQNTAGEIEARDVTARRQLTPEQRRQTMPNTGDENTVFADNFGNSFSVEAAEPVDNPLPSPDQERRSDMFRPAGMSDEQYNRLNEQWKSRPAAQRAEPGAVPEGFDSIDDYTAALVAAAEERMRNRSREEFEGSDALKNLGIRIANSVGLYGNTQQLIENDRAAKSVRKEIKRAERRLQATDAEKNFASGVAAGIYGEADIPPSMDADTVMELADYYWAEKAVQNDLIREQRTKINRNLDERVRRLMDGVDDTKTKVPAAVIMRNRTPERNMRRIFGNAKGDEINDYLFRPVQDNEAERIRFVNRMHNEVRTFLDRDGKNRGLNQEERALVQLVIEGRAAEDAVNAMERSRDIQNAAENIKNARKLAGKDDLVKRRQAEIDASVDEAREFNLGTDERRLAIQYSRWLETRERLEGADTTIIGNAVEKYRELFNQLYDAANDFLVAHGYEPIGFIRGYAPHLQSQETQDRFSSALERMGINREIGKLPTSIAGRTRNFRPNMPWNRFFKHRDSQGEFADPDIAEGFEKYVDSMSDVLYHTDDIMRTRAFVRYFRRTYAPEEIRNQLEQADALRYAPADQQASFLRDQGKLSYTSAPTYEDVHQTMEQYVDEQYQAIESLTLYGDLAIFLDDYANNLANKQLFEDRAMEKSFGRTTLNAASKLHRAFTRAQVSANLSSALNQGGQLPIILAENGTQNVARALLDLRSKDLKSWAAGSDFLTEKKGINYIVTGFGDRAIDAAFKPLEFVDGIVSTLAVRSRYLKEVRAGKSAAEAMRLADRFGREVMASRAKGSTPLAFRSKDFISQMVHMFQLEALNNWEHVTQDLGNRDFREMAQAKGKRAAAGSLAAILVKIVLGAFLLNRIDEELYGGTPAPFDILGLAGNFVAGGLGLTQMDLLQTLVDNGWERLTGERLFGTDAELNEFDAAAGWDDFVWNGLNEIPFASNVAALAGMGDRTLPMPDLSNLTSLPGTIAEDGLFSWEVARQLAGLAGDVLPGGRQIEKSIQGGEALLRGGYYRGSGENRRLQFPVEQDFWNILRGMLFGRSTLEESQAFYASGQTGLSANQTKAYEQIVDMGADPQTVYQAIQGWRAAENDEDLTSYGRNVAKRDAITEADLTDEQKLALYRGLSDADSGTPDHFREMMDTGLSWDQVMEAYDQYQFLNSDEDTPEAERLSASEKATEFASWVERQNYTEDQAETVKEALRYWQMIPAEASQKVLVADEYGISNRSRDAVSKEIDRLKGDGNSVTQDLAEEAIQNVPGLDNRERAVLWQLQNKSWKWNKNPFDKRVGREVYDRMHEEDEE